MFAAALMGALAYGVYVMASDLLELVIPSEYFVNLAALGAAVVMGGCLYFVLVIKLRAVREADLKAMPKGHVFLKIARKLRLL